ncbi:MAG: thiamine pyrophosphate-dependent enzyme [Candidatus Margulisbacteria bacterium]|nr:thiamine pyrophosphate-dependent enzyme [Candidatus Margulisiibacteriota bacterium]
MNNEYEFKEKLDIAWCPGCGNYNILNSIKKAIKDLAIPQQKYVMVSGIGQAAKAPQYIRCNYFNGLHGRALPAATAIKAVNPGLIVVAEGGDGDMYGEGGNHFIHTIRRNPDITHLVHNNMIYGLTKGQASPTSMRGIKTPVQVSGVTLEPFNPLAVALVLQATFVARAFSGDEEKTTEIIKKGMQHKGYALIDIFHPCVSFNKVNNFKWYKDNTYYLPDNYDSSNQMLALEKSLETDRFPLGILYQKPGKPVFEEQLNAYKTDKTPLYQRRPDKEKIFKILEETR